MLLKIYSDSNKITGKGLRNLFNIKFNNLISISLSLCILFQQTIGSVFKA
jgi:hypothetical protein